MANTLVDLPTQPKGLPWPTEHWPTGTAPPGAQELADEMFEEPDRYGTTFAVVMVHRGRLVLERYGGELLHFDRPSEPVGPDTPLLSWSMAKSILHAAIGVLVREGRLDTSAAAPVAEWADDQRSEITIEDLLAMRDGLAFAEDYVDDTVSDVIEMLFGSGRSDVARYAAARPLAHRPGEVFNYSSGTSNVLARIVGDVIGGGAQGYERFLSSELFSPLGMTSARATFDEAGTFVASSYVYATAADFARFGLLYLRDGVWEGRRILPEGWVDHARRVRSVDPAEGRLYGAHWWVVGDEAGGFWANGYEGQSILCVPGSDLVVVRLGKTPKPLYPELVAWRARVTEAFAGL